MNQQSTRIENRLESTNSDKLIGKIDQNRQNCLKLTEFQKIDRYKQNRPNSSKSTKFLKIDQIPKNRRIYKVKIIDKIKIIS